MRGYLRPLKHKNLEELYSTYKNKSGQIGYQIYSNLEIKPIGIVGEGFLEEQSNWILDDCNIDTER